MFINSIDYHELNAGAHRNSPKNISAPALTWHLAFWIRSKSSGERGDPDLISKLRRKIDDFFVSVYKCVKESDPDAQIFPTLTDAQNGVAAPRKYLLLFETALDRDSFKPIDETTLPDRHKDIFRSQFRSIAVKFLWKGLNISMRCEMHTEYVTLTTVAELRENIFSQVTQSEIPKEIEYSTDTVINSKFILMKNYLSEPEKHQQEAMDLRDYFFREFWRSLENYLRSLHLVAPFLNAEAFTDVFADFRGIILSEKVRRFSDENYQFEESKLLHWGQDAKSILLPVLKVPKQYRARNYECTINYMLGGRALYLSSLAPQIPEAPLVERIPVEYIVYAHQHIEDGAIVVNKRQLGRLISHIHICGTLRLAALRDVKMLHMVGSMVSKLDEVMQEARDSIAASQGAAMDKIREAHTRLNDITRLFLDETKSGLAYRIERSRYYVSRFAKNVEFLRIRRLEGNQPYHQFVEKRLGAEFDFIHRLGLRFERTIQNMTALDQNYLAMSSAQIAERTYATQGKIEKIAEKSIETAGRIESIQEWGEFALIGVLVPYYITHLLDFFVSCRLMPWAAVGVWGGLIAWAFAKISRRIGVSKWAGAWAVALVWAGLALGSQTFDYNGIFKFSEGRECAARENATQPPPDRSAPPPERDPAAVPPPK